jgi:hypothetical protein
VACTCGLARKERESGLRKKKRTGPAQGIVSFLMKSKFSIDLNLKRSKAYLPELTKFQLKYCGEVFDVGNNFLHRNFSRFEMDFEL